MKNKNNSFTKGSITVEGTFVSGLALLIIFTILALCFYMHNRAWYSAAAGETAISAATYATREGGDFNEIIVDKVGSFTNGAKFPDICQGLVSQGNDQKMQIGTTARVPLLMGTQSLQMEIDISSKVVKPVEFIRKIQSLQMIKEQIDAG